MAVGSLTAVRHDLTSADHNGARQHKGGQLEQSVENRRGISEDRLVDGEVAMKLGIEIEDAFRNNDDRALKANIDMGIKEREGGVKTGWDR